MEQCEILVTNEEGDQELGGVVTLNNGRITTTPANGHENLMRNVLTEDHELGDQVYTLRANPQQWFESLPFHYNGSMVRARMVW